MNFLQQYYSTVDSFKISVSGKQGSGFAKQVAQDYNPIHDEASRRFCVPGDLLFAVVLDKYGLYQTMEFRFLELVAAGTELVYPDLGASDSGRVEVVGARDKSVLGLEYAGPKVDDPRSLEQLVKSYVAFSGQNFPHILVPLMQQHDVMINPKRPLVIYESMSLNFESLDFSSLSLELEETSLEVLGKRGNASLNFSLKDDGKTIGVGRKKLVLSGLRPYQQSAIDDMCERYLASKTKEHNTT